MTARTQSGGGRRLSPKAIGITAVALGIWLLGGFVPVPGMELGPLDPAGGDSAGLWAWLGLEMPMFAIMSLGLGWLLVLRMVLAWLEPDPRLPERANGERSEGDSESAPREPMRPWGARVPWRLIGFVLYLAVCAVQAAFAIHWAELAAAGPIPFAAVPTPGLAFRITAMATLLGGSALVWVLASWITREGVGYGPLAIAALAGLVAGSDRLFRWGEGTGLGVESMWVTSMQIFTVGPLVVAAWGLWRWPPASWPVYLVPGRLVPPLLSPVDALALLPLLWGAIAYPLQLIVTTIRHAVDLELSWIDGLVPPLGTAVSVGLLLVWLRARHRGTADDSSEPPPEATAESTDTAEAESSSMPQRRPVFVMVVLGAPLLAAALLFGGFASAGGVAGAFERGPYEGDGVFEVVLESPDGTGMQDAPMLLERLRALGVSAQLQSTAPQRLVVVLQDVANPRPVLETVLPSRRLAFHLVTRDQGMLDPTKGGPPPLGLAIESDHGHGQVYVGPTAEALGVLLERIPPTPGRILRIECQADGQQPRCLARLLDEPPLLTGKDVASAEVGQEPTDMVPHVMLQFSPDGARRFSDATGANTGRKLAIVLDERIVMAPLIRERIGGGRAQVTLGAGDSPQELRRQAEALVAALRSGALEGRWSVATSRQLR